MVECIYFFLIGAFAGWLLECVFKFFSKNFTKTPGILNTPFCILYGLGTVVLSVIINKTTKNIWLLFFLSMIALTIMEYITFVLLKKIYNVQLWNYTNMTFNLNEKVCLEFSIIWGVLGAAYIKYILPILTTFFINAQSFALSFSIYLLFAIIIVDFIWSSYLLIRGKRNFKFAEEKNII